MSTQISLHDLTKSCGDRLLFDGVSLSIRPGERAGIVGENGAGKSTLLRLIAGADRPDEGRVVLRADGGVGYLGQTPDLPPHHTVQDAIDTALADLRGMERRLRALERELGEATPGRLAEYGDLLTLFELRGGYEADARVEKALHALGLEGLGRERLLGSLSGGEQARLGLACPPTTSTRPPWTGSKRPCSRIAARSSPSRTTASSSSGSRPRSSRSMPTAAASSATARGTAPSSPPRPRPAGAGSRNTPSGASRSRSSPTSRTAPRAGWPRAGP